MAQLSQRLVLASASPRRKAILEQLGLDFEVHPATVREDRIAGEAPDIFAARLAALKAEQVALRLADGSRPLTVLGADTVVVIDAEILGKPRDDADAARMLSRLSGRSHQVITAVALRRENTDFKEDVAVHTRVTFRRLDRDTIGGYVASGEGRDKAGSYGIQGLGAGLVSAIDGCYSNVVGLPATQTLQLLMRAGVLSKWP